MQGRKRLSPAKTVHAKKNLIRHYYKNKIGVRGKGEQSLTFL
jgi:hypothetical protein